MTDENVLIVQADSAETSLASARLGERRWRCTLGAGGIREDKVEGDAATPVGEFPLRRIYFRNDRVVLPKTGLPARPINEHDGWCDDPRAPTYNRLVHIPNEWSHEKMWREDGLYDVVVVVGYNDDPPEGEWGSAIFLHIAREDYSPTQGCVAFSRDDLLELLPLLTRDTRLRVLSHPADEAARPASAADDEMKQFEDFDEKDW
jgi:L,D-peptidoglycan transpeptidase YkuD (ErfK/YbiS/YcfS/YnhG family)